jgi:parallel beta-helix repeat protein
LAKVNASTFKAGDQILFQKGDTFYGTITVKNSGSSGNPITFGAYGTGADPIITGFTNVTAWTNLGGNIWESTSSVSTLSTCNMVVIKRVNTPMGREPNTGYYYYQSHLGTTQITSNNLIGTPNWVGAELAFNNTTYTTARVPITGQSGSTLTFTPDVEDYDIQMDGLKFIIQNNIRTLDTQNEWYYNPSTKKISIYSLTQPANVEITSTDVLASVINTQNITFQNISFEGSNRMTFLLSNAKNITIESCNLNFTGGDAVYGSWSGTSNDFKIENCTVNNSNNGGVGISGDFSNAIIRSNTIINTGMIYGTNVSPLPAGNGSSIFDGISALGVGSLIEKNTIQNTGYIGINFKGNNIVVQNNFVDGFCLTVTDGGGIYTNNHVGTALSGMKVLNNIILNGATDVGIYMDDKTNGIEISGNTSANNNIGLFLHNTYNVIVENNTTYNNDTELNISNNDYSVTMSGNVIQNNNFISKTATQKSGVFDPAERIQPNITFDNNYYARPIDKNLTFILQFAIPSYDYRVYTFEQWQSYSGQDANSHKSPQAITTTDDLQFEYNATTTAKTVTLSRPMTDVKGIKYATSLTLQPFTSVVLMKDLTLVIIPDAPTSVIATAGNASATVTFSAPANNGGSSITGYTVTSIPSGGIDSNAGSTLLNHTINGLTNGTSYTFTVKATNSVGTSVASMASNSVTPKALTASSFTFTGPSSGSLNSASTIFTVTPNNLYTGTITITPTGTGSSGLSAKVFTFFNSSAAQTYTITPTVAGSIILTATNNGSLTNPGNLTYSANAVVPDAPTSVVAIAGDASASVAFVATTNNGGSAITGYTVASNPAVGIDINAGSTSLNHTITGLTNGMSYYFLVKAINTVGSSSFSAASNSITIATGITNLDDGVKIVVFPNPCHGRFTVRFSEIPISESRIEVLSLSGRKVTSQIITGISQDIVLFGQPPGMYFVKSIIGSIEKINKLVIQ